MGGKGFDYHMAEKRAVLDKPWDVVVGHGYSTLDRSPSRRSDALDHSPPSRWRTCFAAQNPNVKFYLLATWSRADKVYPANAPAPWKGTPIAQMGKDVEKGYEAAAKNAGSKWPASFRWAWPGTRRSTQGVADGNPYDDTGRRQR